MFTAKISRPGQPKPAKMARHHLIADTLHLAVEVTHDLGISLFASIEIRQHFNSVHKP